LAHHVGKGDTELPLYFLSNRVVFVLLHDRGEFASLPVSWFVAPLRAPRSQNEKWWVAPKCKKTHDSKQMSPTTCAT